MAWELTGNAGTNPNTNFLGTTDAQPLVLRTNSAEAVRVGTVGSIGVDTSNDFGLQVTTHVQDQSPQHGIAIQAPNEKVGAGLQLQCTGPDGRSWELLAAGKGSAQAPGQGNKFNIRDLATTEDVFTIAEAPLVQGGSSDCVGIGNTAPQFKLHVVAQDQRGLEVQGPNSGPNGVGAGLVLQPTETDGRGWELLAAGKGSAQALGQGNKFNIRDLVTTADVITIDGNNNDNVGINTREPHAKLHITSGGDFNSPQVQIDQTTRNDFARLRFESSRDDPDGVVVRRWDIATTPDVMNFFVSDPGVNIMTLTSIRRVGINTDNPQASLHVVGDLRVEGGQKNFVQAHPTDPTKEIVYVALEGGEAGTYIRGTWKLDNGKAVIELPEHFSLVTSEDGLTIQLTPRGEWHQLYVVQLNTRQVIVQEAQGKSGQFDYHIHGVRKGYEHYEPTGCATRLHS